MRWFCNTTSRQAVIFDDRAFSTYKLEEYFVLVLKSKEQLDAGIIEKAKTDTEAFGQIYDFYFPRVYAFVVAKIGDHTLAEDLVSDIFVKLLDNLPKYQKRG